MFTCSHCRIVSTASIFVPSICKDCEELMMAAVLALSYKDTEILRDYLTEMIDEAKEDLSITE